MQEIKIETYYQAWHEIGSEEAKWHPKTRETADHSMPYIFSAALRDGEITVATFDEKAFTDPKILAFMKKVTIAAVDEFSSQFPASIPIRVTAVTNAGATEVIELANPLGHDKNPMSDADVTAKFLKLVAPAIGVEAAMRAADRWWSVDSADNLTEALDMLAPTGSL